MIGAFFRYLRKHLRVILLAVLLAELLFFVSGQWRLSFYLPQKTKAVVAAKDRILILAPHPDDEILGCGGIIQRASKLNIPLKIVFLTYGDNNQWSFLIYRKHPVFMPKAVRSMGLIRREEAIAANEVLGAAPDKLIFLGYPDFKTLNIWYANWGPSRPAASSMLTKVKAVPYANAFHPGAPYKGETILEDLKTIIRNFKPTKIFVSHPADFNADHKALYLFTRVALWDLASEIKATVHPYLIHYKKWPLPRGYHPHATLIPPEYYKNQIEWKVNVLTSEEVQLNRSAIEKHRSQYSSTAGYLLTFIRSPELFGDFPNIIVRPATSGVFTASEKDEPEVSPDELEKEVKDRYVGIEERSAYFTDHSLVISICLSRRMGKAAALSLFAFGYRHDKAFMDMPKIRIRVGAFGYKVLDQNKKVLNAGIIIKREERKIIVTIPLAVLGNPEKILTSANTYLGAIPLDSVPWRILEIQNNVPSGNKVSQRHVLSKDLLARLVKIF